MKPSPYNHFFPLEDAEVVLGYNAFNGALAEIENAQFDRVKQLLGDPSLAGSPEDYELVQCLTEGGFLIPDMVDQAGTLRASAKRLRRMGSVLGLTIAPTLACNFGCEYCFEARSNLRMSSQTQDALLAYCDRYLQRAEALRLWWFGGEPTICMPIVDRIQTSLLELAARYKVEVDDGEIITNGYLLNTALARHLRDIKITRAQITIDGPQAVHDQRRKLANGNGTFHRILDNLSETAELMEINIRINVDKENAESACEVVEILAKRGILPKVAIHFGHVQSSGAACSGIRDRCFTDVDFSRTQIALYKRLHERGLYVYRYPTIRTAGASCAALAEGYYVIGPDGQMYKCWEDLSFGPAKAIGTVFDNGPVTETQKKNLEAYRTWDPFGMPECLGCNILPICTGGCPAHGMRDSNGQRGQCVPAKYHLGDLVTIRYRSETRTEATP